MLDARTGEEAVAGAGETVVVAQTREALVGWRKGDSFEISREQNGADLVMDGT
jgi:hypothetical protein